MREGEDGYDIRVRWKGVEGIFKETYTTMLYVAAICRLNVNSPRLIFVELFRLVQSTATSSQNTVFYKRYIIMMYVDFGHDKRDNLATDIGIGVPA